MHTQLRQLKWHQIILLLAMLFGGLVRLAPILIADFPINDGGMFYTMIRDLIANHFRLPAYTTYNLSNIPYAYPPAGFYLMAGLHVGTGISELTLLRWIPAFLNILSIFLFYKMAACLLKKESLAAVATACYALLPGSYTWFVMGGGLTRSLGGAAFILSVTMLYKLFESRDKKYLLFAILACTLSVLSHPEAALHTAASGLLLWLFFGRSGDNTLRAGAVAAGTLILSAVWWGPVLVQHGFAPFISAVQTGDPGKSVILYGLLDFLSLSTYIPILALLRLAGVVSVFRSRNFFLLAWMILPYLIEPRSAYDYSMFPLALLGGLGWDEISRLVRTFLQKRRGEAAALADIQSRTPTMLLVGSIFYLFIVCALLTYRHSNTILPPSVRPVFSWIEAQTPADGQFLILTGDPYVMVTPVQEWFPALTQRRSVTTLQGLEWSLGGQFFQRSRQLRELQKCETVDCVSDWALVNDLQFTSILAAKNTAFVDLISELRVQHTPIYETADWIVINW